MQEHPRILGIIPARLESQRLPGKVLRNIGSKPMLHWVYERASASALLSELWVATDSDKVEKYCRENGIPVLRTREHPSGSDRLCEVMERTQGTHYVNIQGDEPTVRPDHIELLLRPLLAGEAEVTTLKVAMDEAAAQNPDCVKVVTDRRGRALYFSRFPIPFDRNAAGGVRFYKHIGLYAYTRAALQLFQRMGTSALESAEKLEQLRYLENGIPIVVAETPHDTIGVDTEADLKAAAAYLAG